MDIIFSKKNLRIFEFCSIIIILFNSLELSNDEMEQICDLEVCEECPNFVSFFYNLLFYY
jgi:hypothetical protein